MVKLTWGIDDIQEGEQEFRNVEAALEYARTTCDLTHGQVDDLRRNLHLTESKRTGTEWIYLEAVPTITNRPKHFQQYSNSTEIVPGVFVDPGEAVYIVDNEGEVATWNADEWAEDAEAVTATINACIIAATLGANAVRRNLTTPQGTVLTMLIDQTFATTSKAPTRTTKRKKST